VLAADPVVWEDGRWKPFPTFLWLVCPRLKLVISHLEQGRMNKEQAFRLRTDASYRTTFEEGQERMKATRWELACRILGPDRPAVVAEVLAHTTIAGSRSPFGVKCLHAHVAHELALGGNPIGAAVLERVGRCAASIPCLDHNPHGFGSSPDSDGEVSP
jgi:hypothetical protein